MQPNIEDKLLQQEEKIEAIYVSVEKTRKYLLIIMWSSVAMIVLPILIGLLIVPFVISSFTSTYSSISSLGI